MAILIELKQIGTFVGTHKSIKRFPILSQVLIGA
jgi:hypothetical protein